MIRTLIEGSLDDAEHYVACPEEGAYFGTFREMLGTERVWAPPWRVRRITPDIIHTHGFGAGLLGRLANLGTGVPVVHTFHGFFPRGAGVAGGAVRLAAEALLAPSASAAVAVSESEKRLVQRLCPHLARRTVVIANGVKPKSRGAAGVAGTAGAAAKIRVLAIGRLVYQKFPQMAVRIASICRRLEPTLELEFRLAGAGPLAEETLQMARLYGVANRIRLLGDVGDVGAELASAQIYLSTARWEGLSLALLEAMHAGLACVASRVQGNMDAIEDGRTGLLFDADSPEQAAQHIVSLGRDPLARRAYGLHAMAAAQARFSVESMCGQYLNLYRHLLDACPQSALDACPGEQT
jgi:glycosyltransferase involved in cell wall biosynthesis